MPDHTPVDTPPALTRVTAARRLGQALVVVLAVATATVWAQAIIVFARRELLGQFSWNFWLRDQFLLSTIGYLLLFAIAGLVPVAAHLLAPRRLPWAVLLGGMTALGAFSVLLLFEQVAPPAWLFVAIGIGVQAYRMASAAPDRARRMVRRVAVLGHLAGAVVVVGTGSFRTLEARASLAALPDAAPGAPNVLVLLLDTVRAGSMSLYGAPWPTTPALDRRARDGVVFDAAYSTAPWTLPSHASIFTGHFPSQTVADWQSPLDTTAPTLAEVFQARGYATGGFVANINIAGYRSGLGRGFIRYEDAQLSVLEALLSTTILQSQSARRAFRTWARTRWIRGTVSAILPLELRPMSTNPAHDDLWAEEIADNFLAWLPSVEGRPFFAFLNLFDAHGPMPPPPAYQAMFDPAESSLGHYAGAIRYMDDAIEVLLRALEAAGQLDQTIVVVTSDHGEQFGEHDLRLHGNSLYRPVLHVPLVLLNALGVPAGHRVARPVSLRDLPATLLDLASIGAELPGVSLAPLLRGDTTGFEASPVLSELSRGLPERSPPHMMVDRKSLVTDTSHIIRTSAGALEVFAYPADTAEMQDRSSLVEVRAAAEAQLAQALRRVGIEWRR